MQELDELTNRLRERLHVTSSRAPFQSPVATETSHDQPTSNDVASRISPNLAVSSQPFASDSLDDIQSAPSKHESHMPGALIDNAVDQLVKSVNREEGKESAIVGGSTDKTTSVYESALQNARQMLENINQHMYAGPEAGTLTVSATYELTSAKDVTIAEVCDDAGETPATVTRHAHFDDDDADDTFGPFWNRDNDYDDDDDDDVNDDDVTVVEARPLNDVSSANFCNGLPDAVLVRGQTTFTEFSGGSSTTQLSSSVTQLSVDYGMDDDDYDEFDHSGRPYASNAFDNVGYLSNRSGAYSRLNYNANSNAESAETGTHVASGDNSANDPDSEEEGKRAVAVNGMRHTARNGMLKRQGAEDGSCSSSDEEEERENRRGPANETSNDFNRVNDYAENDSRTVKVNGINSVDISEHSSKSSSNSQDSIHRQRPTTSSIHGSEHSRRSSVSSQGSRILDSLPSEVVKRNDPDDVFSDDVIDRNGENGENTPSDSLSPDRTHKKPPASPKQGKHDTAYPFFQILAVIPVDYLYLGAGEFFAQNI